MAFTGMDIPAVRQMATQMEQASGEIEQLVARLTGTLNGTQWEGPDANAFRSEWEGQHTAALRNVGQALQTVSQRARANADEQEAASNG